MFGLKILSRRFWDFVLIKIIIIILICIFVINLYLFYNLKSIGYQQNTVDVLQNEQNYLRQLDKTTQKSSICKVGNYSVFVSDSILQIREDLEDFYLNASGSTVLASRCLQFLSNKQSTEQSRLILTDERIDFANKKLILGFKNSKVLKVQNAPKGTQLKLLTYLSNNITAIVKPRWYSASNIVIGPVYAGKDRHYGEVIAFYLSVLMDLRRVPPAVIRTFDIQTEIISVADQELLDTFLWKDNMTCFYGVCHYCNPLNLLCTATKKLEGSIIFYLSSIFSLKVLQHPWRRTYRCSAVARWEIDENYCTIIRNSRFYSKKQNRAVFLDLMDTAIFDFLIDNGDRHHYEYATNLKTPRLLLVDNGKSFGNPYTDHIDILAPLYQCCMLRNSTWSNLLHLRGGNLSKWLKLLLRKSDGNVKMNELHYQALDRRLLLIFAAMKRCFQKFGVQNVLVVD